MSEYSNKSVFITGANGGMGVEVCRYLVEDGFGHITMACRTEGKATAAMAEVRKTTNGSATDVTTAAGFDMTDPAAIEAAVDALPADRPFDVVFLQAGGVVYGKDWKSVTWNGVSVERTVFQNVVGAHVTLSRLMHRGLVKPGARVVIAGGEGARGIPGLIGKPEFASADDFVNYALVADPSRPYVDMDAMGVSKFAGALWSQKVAQLLEDQMDVVWFTPGFTAGTKGLKGVGAFKQWMFENIGFPVMVALGKAQSAKQGARKFADSLEGKVGKNGDVIGAPEGTALGAYTDQKPMNPGLTDPAIRDAFWNILEEVTGPFPTASSHVQSVHSA